METLTRRKVIDVEFVRSVAKKIKVEVISFAQLHFEKTNEWRTPIFHNNPLHVALIRRAIIAVTMLFRR